MLALRSHELHSPTCLGLMNYLGIHFFYCDLHQHIVELLLQSFHTSIKPLEVAFEFSIWHSTHSVLLLYIFPSYAVKLMHAYIPERLPDWSRTYGISQKVSYIGTRLHQPSSTGSSLLRLTGLTLIFTTSRGHSDPGWGINAKKLQKCELVKVWHQTALEVVHHTRIFVSTEVNKALHTHTHTEDLATTVSSRTCLSPVQKNQRPKLTSVKEFRSSQHGFLRVMQHFSSPKAPGGFEKGHLKPE